ncbi:MAG: diaminopimelate epimerase [Actinobacteria bacterium]|nr:MAG: diaminopimelate epimerase [Actinomycetota bacterium]
MRFEKWQALGNDYVIVEKAALTWELTQARIRRLCDQHTGIGSDGILLISESDDPACVATVRIFNPDGSEAELSGNGVRQAVLYLDRANPGGPRTFCVLTKAGRIEAAVTGRDTATLEMGRASLTSPDYPGGPPDGRGMVEAAGREWNFQHVSIGNPQCVIDAGDGLEELDLAVIGPQIATADLFPNRTNVSFIRVDGSTLRARIFERGVGETSASGTGASGAAVAASLRGASSPITVRLDGGELEVDVTDELDVRLTGTASRVYRGEISTDLAQGLAALT